MSEEDRKRPPLGIRVQDHSTVYSGYLKVDRYKLSHEHYQGGWSKVLDREVMHRKEISAVLPYDPNRQEIVLIEQFRIGAWAGSWPHPWLLECVAAQTRICFSAPLRMLYQVAKVKSVKYILVHFLPLQLCEVVQATNYHRSHTCRQMRRLHRANLL